ncbi:MAG: site-specific integrase [Paraclostridium sp.]
MHKDKTIKYKIEPIKDLDVLELICEYLKERNDRDYTLFIVGIYSGLRISDILELKVKDVKSLKYIRVKEKKTDKSKMIEVNPILSKVLKDYITNKKDYEYLFQSRKGINKPMTRNRAYIILREAGEVFGLDMIGSHTMRKTFGYHYYRQTKDIAFLQKIFNHSSPSITLDYIGMTQDSINKAYREFRYK